MKDKRKKIIRSLIYIVLFAVIIFAFIYLGDKYSEKSQRKEITFNDYYKNISKTNRYDVIKANGLIKSMKKEKHIVFIGSSNSIWSVKYAKLLTDIFDEMNLKNIQYYDLESDKSQKNSNYYEIKEILKGSLTYTDGSENNLLAPSLYILDDGVVKYYNIDTVAMKNNIEVNEYWTKERINLFKKEIKDAINKYYLN